MATVLTHTHPLDGVRQLGPWAKSRSLKLWRSYPRETVGLGVLGIVVAGALVVPSLTHHPQPRSSQAAPPAPPPMVVRPIAPDQAVKLNAAIPVNSGPNPAAAPFVFQGNAATRNQALTCLASAIYYEAGNQDADGERAVAQVVLNRVRHPAFPGTICGVVYEGSTKPTGCQFTFTCDNSLDRQPDTEGWRRALAVAEAALNGFVYDPVGWATHYHADYVVPVWAATMAKNAVVGAHLFYRWAGSWGRPAAFARIYRGHEPSASALRTAALSVPHIAPNYAQRNLQTELKVIPGAEPLKLSPSLRGNKRVAARFNLVARKASDDVKHTDYTNQFEVSDNLKWSLSGDSVAQNQQPLGHRAASTTTSQSSTGETGQR
ncbi:MAG TPA: cell wall hydrolase [Sphingomicrobium sp.]|nr:cell wall hydrolase [Sphingomicrobium sp.]